MSEPEDLVYIDEHGLIGSNFYWHKYESKGLTKEDILEAGLTSDRVQVAREIVEPLQRAEEALRPFGYRLYIKEGYRAKSLYEIVYKRRVEKFGKTETDSLLNMEGMPHAQGLSVDVALWSIAENKEVYLRNGEDGTAALFTHFYRDKEGDTSKHYQELQDLLINTMMTQGFRLGTKNEYFHFDYRPDMLPNYV